MSSDKTVFVICMLIGVVFFAQTMYQFGYDEGRGYCRPAVKIDIQHMSAKAQRAWVRYLAARSS
jgi:hypothetical protein